MSSKASTSKFSTMQGTHVGRFQHLLGSGMCSDIELIIGEHKERVKSHKIILMTGSPYFKNKLEADKTITQLRFLEMKFDVFWRFLKFMYTGEMCDDVEYAVPLLTLAAFFKVPDLEEFCQKLVQEDNGKLAKESEMEISNQAVDVESRQTDVCSAIQGTHVGRFQLLLNSGLYSDIELIIGENKELVKSHKLILMTGSPYFWTKLHGDNTITELSFPDIKFDVFWRFLKFLYSGQMFMEVQLTNPLMKAAEYFEVPDLVQLCKDFFQASITEQNALRMFQQALGNGMNDLEEIACQELCRYAYEIVESDDFFALSPDCLAAILKRNELVLYGEIQLFEALVRWSEEECWRQDLSISPKSCRSVMGNLVSFIRFDLINPTDFSTKVAPKNILTWPETVPILLNYKSQRTPTAIPKTKIVLRILPWTEMEDVDVLVRSITLDGLAWGFSESVTSISGRAGLNLTCVLDDNKLTSVELIKKIKKCVPADLLQCNPAVLLKIESLN